MPISSQIVDNGDKKAINRTLPKKLENKESDTWKLHLQLYVIDGPPII